MDMDKLVSLCKRRGIIFPSSEIYGGLNGFWDYGPLGVELKRNIKDAWWRDNITLRDDMVGIDCSIIMNPKVWEASGHVGGFSDPMVDCRETKERYRADQLHVFWYDLGTVRDQADVVIGVAVMGGTVDDARASLSDRLGKLSRNNLLPIKMKELPEPGVFAYLDLDLARRDKVFGPSAAKPGTLTEPRNFNLMFESHAGAIADEANKVYLRPETAQGIFANFKNVVDTGRVKVPFGIGQVGKSFRNEINPRNFIFRSREFEQMEIEFFCHPDQVEPSGTPTGGRPGSSGTSTTGSSPTASAFAITTPTSWRSTRPRRPTSNTLSRSASANSKGSRTGGPMTWASIRSSAARI